MDSAQAVVELWGLTLPDDEDILRRAHRRSLKRGNYERPEREALARVMRRGDRVLELGAGIGFLSTIAARDHGAAAVLSFEANPKLLPYIAQVHRLNGVSAKTTVRNALLAAKDGPAVPFYVRGDFVASSMTDDRGDKYGGVVETAMIPQVGFDGVRKEFRPDILICDIEGGEADLIPRLTLTGIRAAVLEIHPDSIGAKGVKAVFDAFSKAGFAYDVGASEHAVVTFVRIDP